MKLYMFAGVENMAAPRVMRGNRGGRILVVNDYRYERHRSKTERIHWRCWRPECRSRLRTNLFDIQFDGNPNIHILFQEEHNHVPEEVMVDRAQHLTDMRGMIQEDPSRPVRRVYDSSLRQIRQLQGGGDRPVIENFVSFRTSLNRCRNEHLPDIPRVVADVHIFGTWAETWGDDQFLQFARNDWGLAIFATHQNIQVMSECSDLYMDGTFRSTPRPYEQIFTVHGNYRGHVIPLVHVLMEQRQVAHYRRVLRDLKHTVLRITGHHWSPRNVICDFEVALITAVETELPRTSIAGCYFHFCRNLWMHIQDLGLRRAYRNDDHLRKVLRQVMALGYLPRALVRMNFGLLWRSRRTQRLANHYPALREFFLYVSNTYINGQFGPSKWNVYQRNMSQRTNNHVESKCSFLVSLLTSSSEACIAGDWGVILVDICLQRSSLSVIASTAYGQRCSNLVHVFSRGIPTVLFDRFVKLLFVIS